MTPAQPAEIAPPRPISPAKLAANRKNALQSTGPRTEEGKQTVSQNAVKHGLLAQAPTFAGEDPHEFDAFLRDSVIDLKAVGTAQESLAERIAYLQWKLKRLPHIEAELINKKSIKDAEIRNCCGPIKREPLQAPSAT